MKTGGDFEPAQSTVLVAYHVQVSENLWAIIS